MEMSLVASQLPLTREPGKECGARGRGDFAWVVSVELFGATGGASSSPTKSRKGGAKCKELEEFQ